MLILPVMVGGNFFLLISLKAKTAPKTIYMSRPMTVTVSHMGMTLGVLIEGIERAIKDMVMSTLSPMGSRRAPRFDFCLKILAIAPSKKSVETATINIIKASNVFPERIKSNNTGLKTRREIEMILGTVIISFFSFFFIVSTNSTHLNKFSNNLNLC